METLVVVGSSPLFRAGLASLLDTMGFKPVKQAADLKDLLKRYDEAVGPEIALINIARGADVASLMEDIGAWAPATKVVFLAPDLDLDLLSGCFAAGATGYLLENISPQALEECIRLVRAGEKVFPSELASLIPGFTAKNGKSLAASAADLHDSNLSDREIDILRCLANGQSNKAIANKLNIAESTVKVHVKRILQKTNACNRTQAALWGAARGLATMKWSLPGG